ncbi:MAG: hypothetical protein HW374_401 [Bacteroidetes bacterium]|nr:hypothetical protein [Bacteroidota bacterium]
MKRVVFGDAERVWIGVDIESRDEYILDDPLESKDSFFLA